MTLKKADNHWAEIKSGKVTCRIVGMADCDFPKVPDHREASYATVESAVVREMIERTMFSICNDETQFHLNGVFFRRPTLSAGERRAHWAHEGIAGDNALTSVIGAVGVAGAVKSR